MLLDDGEELDGHAAGLFYAALPLLHRGLAGVEGAGKDRGSPTHPHPTSKAGGDPDRMKQRRDEWGSRQKTGFMSCKSISFELSAKEALNKSSRFPPGLKPQ